MRPDGSWGLGGGGGGGVQNWKWQNPDAHTVTLKEVSLKGTEK